MGFENTDWRQAAASTLDWWRDAGVDVLVEDMARDWFAVPSHPGEGRNPGAAKPEDATVERGSALRGAGFHREAALPGTWDEFLSWRFSVNAPEAELRGVAVTATGPAKAPLMILADCPDRDDEPAGALLSGAAGRLFDRMLAAIGLARGDVHLAAVCTKRPIAGRMPPELVEQLHDCARHHVGLVAPQRLLLLGNAASRAVLATDTAHARGALRPFVHKGGEVGVIATHHPRALLEQPQLKAQAWKDLQMLVKDWAR